ncbi:T9SS type A sorting domain-containing protein [Flavobacterium silvaticum]|uniref:T9SS type A sorting domain-containing protein n=1 Tax=Flavobacterium silvaticum TaxID=1852020 RepID=A0A972JH20_9FLAO|nr:T9SS type A sorting domain-containing protein [Flavobacterium silvaticum]NMH27480.1 T9SS type A sorting domain-containing protein [Flavobacterium silvaticum]
MKKYLLVCLIGFSAFAQSPIPTFYGYGSWPAYTVCTTPTPIDQTASGENITWNFDQLVELGLSESHTIDPLPAEVTTFPNTTLVNQTNTMVGGTSYLNNIYFSDTAGTVSVTGVSNPDVTLNFSTNNATLGAFPMAYGFSNSDAIAGTFAYSTYEGTFTGTAVTTVDAYGTLSMNISGIGPNTPIEVTRLKTVMTLSLNYILPNVGTIIQTTYSYYAANYPGYPIFRSTTNDISVPIASINDVTTTYESFQMALLNAPEASVPQISLAKNPVRNVLEIVGADTIEKIEIADLSGRIVSQTNSSESIDVSGLSSGVYVALIHMGQNTVSRKFIKITE